MKKRTYILTLFLINLFASALAFAQVDTLVVQVENASNQPVEGVSVELIQMAPLAFAVTDATGRAEFPNVGEGLFDIKIVPSMSNCSSCKIFKDKKVEQVEVSQQSQGFQNGTLILDPIALTQADVVVELLVQDQSGQPISGVEVNAFKNYFGPGTPGDGGTGGPGTGAPGPENFPGVDEPSFAFGMTNDNGVFAFAASEGPWSASNLPNVEYAGGFVDFEVSGSETQATLVLRATDAVILLSVVDTNGVAVEVPQGKHAGLECVSSDYTDFFHKEIFADTEAQALTNVAIPVVTGPQGAARTFICRLFMPGAGSSEVGVTIAAEEQKSAEIVVRTADCELTVNFVDGTGAQINVKSIVSAFTSPESSVQHFADALTSQGDGTYKLNLLGEQDYELSHFPAPDEMMFSGIAIAENNTAYIPVSPFAKINTNSCPLSYSFEMQAADVELKVTTSPGAWVDAVSDAKKPSLTPKKDGEPVPADEFNPGFFIGAPADQNGIATLHLASGRTYKVHAWPAFGSGSSQLPPAGQTITPEAGLVELTMLPLESDVSVAATVVFPAGANPEWVGCAAFSESVFNFADASNNVATIPLVQAQGPYKIECFGGTVDTFYLGETAYTPSGNSTDSVTVTVADFGTVYPQKSVSLSATSSQEITLGDGCSTALFPANSVASSGNFTFTYGSKQGASPATEGLKPIGLQEFSVVTDSGTTVTEFNSPITFKFCVDPDLYPENFDFSQITCVGSNESGTGLQSIDCSVDTNTTAASLGILAFGDIKVTFQTDHFSEFGLNRSDSPSGETTLDAPESVKAKKAKSANSRSKKTKAQITWSAVTDAASYIVTISRTQKGETTETTKTVKASNKAKIKKTFKLKKQGKYTFSVAAVSDSGKVGHSATDRKKIKVKKKKN